MTKISKKIGKMWKDMTGVSPIIAVILMVAITVVLAATIYVWVSGFGGGSGETPSIAMRYDPVNDRLEVTSADPDLNWKDINIVSDLTAGTHYKNYTVDGTEITVGTDDQAVSAGDYIEIQSAASSGSHWIQLIYTPTNSQLGKWTFTY